MDDQNILPEMLEMDNSLISEISGTITELDEKLEASNGVLLEMQEHYVSLFGKITKKFLKLIIKKRTRWMNWQM